MWQNTDEVLEVPVALPETECAEIVVKLLDIIGSPEVTAAQEQESLSRLTAMKAGELDVVDDGGAFRLING